MTGDSLGSVHLHTIGARALWSSGNFENYCSDSLQDQNAHWIFFLFNSTKTLWIHISVIGNYVHIWKEQILRSYPPYLHCLSGTYAQARTPSNHH